MRYKSDFLKFERWRSFRWFDRDENWSLCSEWSSRWSALIWKGARRPAASRLLPTTGRRHSIHRRKLNESNNPRPSPRYRRMSSRGYRSGSLSTTRSEIVISVSVCSVYCSEVNSYHFSTRQIRFLFSFRLCFSFVHSQGKVSKPGNSKNYETLELCKRIHMYVWLANCKLQFLLLWRLFQRRSQEKNKSRFSCFAGEQFHRSVNCRSILYFQFFASYLIYIVKIYTTMQKYRSFLDSGIDLLENLIELSGVFKRFASSNLTSFFPIRINKYIEKLSFRCQVASKWTKMNLSYLFRVVLRYYHSITKRICSFS